MRNSVEGIVGSVLFFLRVILNIFIIHLIKFELLKWCWGYSKLLKTVGKFRATWQTRVGRWLKTKFENKRWWTSIEIIWINHGGKWSLQRKKKKKRKIMSTVRARAIKNSPPLCVIMGFSIRNHLPLCYHGVIMDLSTRSAFKLKKLFP